MTYDDDFYQSVKSHLRLASESLALSPATPVHAIHQQR